MNNENHCKYRMISLSIAILQTTGSADKAVAALVAGIFGPSGLTSCTDDISYDEVLRQLRRDTLPAVPRELQSYFTDKLEPLLKFNVDASCGQWTNNAWESINHVLKQRQQWQRHMLPDLVENLQSLISSQYAEEDRAISEEETMLCARATSDVVWPSRTGER